MLLLSHQSYIIFNQYSILQQYKKVTSSTKSPLVASAFLEKKHMYIVNAGSTWGQYFMNAELEKMLNQDLSRLYPELGDFFQTSTCQSMLILLVWSLRYPKFGYRQGKSLISFQSLRAIYLLKKWLIPTKVVQPQHDMPKCTSPELVPNLIPIQCLSLLTTWNQNFTSKNNYLVLSAIINLTLVEYFYIAY